MANFEGFVEKVMATAGKVADKSVEIAKVAGDKAKLMGRITKLKTEIAVEKDSIRRNHAEIGKLYYEKYKDNPEEDMAQAIAEATLSMEKVVSKQKEVIALKKLLADDFEDFTEDVEDAVEHAAEKAEEVVEEVTDKDEE